MYTEGLEQLFKLTKNSTLSFNEWNKATTDVCRRLTEHNLELIGTNFNRMSDQLKRLSHVRKPEDFINLQKEIITEDMTAGIEILQKMINISLENMESLTKLYNPIRDAMTQSRTPEMKTEKSSK